LLRVGHIRKIQYPEWLANVVLLKKANGKWRMCVEGLNKACLKGASGCRLFSFLDPFSSYNQIMMHPRDECKTTFMTKLSCYCYKMMPFALKKVGATYQRLMHNS